MGNRSNLKRLTGKFTRFDNRKKFAKEVFKNKKAGGHLGGCWCFIYSEEDENGDKKHHNGKILQQYSKGEIFCRICYKERKVSRDLGLVIKKQDLIADIDWHEALKELKEVVG